MGLGADRVRVSFNPSGGDMVEDIKRRTAELIDLCNEEAHRPSSQSGETQRLWSLAMTHYEDAAMWAVKAVTAKNP
jgi:hypothetical protein